MSISHHPKILFAESQVFTYQLKRFQTHFLQQNSPKTPISASKTAQKTAFLPHFLSKSTQKTRFSIKKTP